MWHSLLLLCLVVIDMEMCRQIELFIDFAVCTAVNIRLKADMNAIVTAFLFVNY